ncbi:MAG TPA: AAA family ATPase [Acholeplasmataceae bacterium]|nr:AAA family ATPase [Acholeplasmataceae bacterium]
MKINIKNYKNISDLEFFVEEQKINCLFGISGSGKTSIAEGLLSYNFEENFSIGMDESDIAVIVDGEIVSSERFRYYNIETQNALIIEQSYTNDVYSILFGDAKSLDNAKMSLRKMIIDLEKFQTAMTVFKNEIEKVKKEFIGKINKDGTLSKKAKLYLLEDDIKKISSNVKSLKLLREQGSDVIDWKIKGTTINSNYVNKKCPFCEAELNDDSIEFIEVIKKISPKNFDIVTDSKIDFEMINVTKPNDYTNNTELTKFKEQLIRTSHISDEVDIIMQFLSSVRNPSYNPSDINEISVSQETLTQFKGLAEIINDINGKLKEVRKLMGEMKVEFGRMVGQNVKRINDYVKRLGIPYEFALDNFDSDDKTATFKLYHVKDKSKKHRVGGLSFGEKNMLSLILFLLIQDDKMLLIDDPASSYDDYRRKTILDIIYEFTRERTCVILSHDHVFLKYALFQQRNALNKQKRGLSLSRTDYTYFNNTGKIMYFENLSTSCIKEIAFEDFQPIHKHVQNHLYAIENTASFYRKVLNLRLIAEMNKYQDTPDNDIIYQFLSALLHKKELKEISRLLNQKGRNIEEIIDKIKDVLSYDLVNIPDDYTNVNDLSDFTLFEKAILKREEISNSIEKDELDNLVHFNDSLAIQINPYKFNLFSKYVFEII